MFLKVFFPRIAEMLPLECDLHVSSSSFRPVFPCGSPSVSLNFSSERKLCLLPGPQAVLLSSYLLTSCLWPQKGGLGALALWVITHSVFKPHTPWPGQSRNPPPLWLLRAEVWGHPEISGQANQLCLRHNRMCSGVLGAQRLLPAVETRKRRSMGQALKSK